MPKWDYVCVNLVRSYGMNYRRNGIKMAEWKDKPIFEVMQTLGEEGYEFSAFDGQNYIFKKPLGVPQPATGQVQTRPPQASPAPAAGQPQPLQRPTQPVQGLQPRPQPPQAGQTGPQPPTGLRSLRPAPQEDDS
jgi:hypothetical protein